MAVQFCPGPYCMQKKIGEMGEKIAQNYLKKKGYQILETNFCFKLANGLQEGEIDIVAKKQNIIFFVEVKALQQTQNRVFSPENKVNSVKIRRILRTAEYWLIKNKIPLDSKWQLDIVAITIEPHAKTAKVAHLENIANC